MPELISDLFVGLLNLLGISVDGSSERRQTLAFFAFCGLFGLVAGCCSTGVSATLWFIVGGFSGLAFLIVVCRKIE